ncbi:MAG: metallophosphoesterase family protein [Candidatus Hydrogenedentes bacterium]|nr:metallophosphoesterase family protein [Candidatus Hydrogenedentota bacterium]
MRIAQIALLFLICATARAQESTQATMDAIVARFTAEMDPAAMDALDSDAILSRITPEERAVLATKHSYFDVDIPVVVSVLRDAQQSVVPFWLTERGFEKSGLVVTNMLDWNYEVWQKSFPAGRVELGINGFDQHRAHYLVGVGPQEAGAKPVISNRYPAQHAMVTLEPGAPCYWDWSDLVLKEVPEALLGHTFLTTVRGRSREAHIIQAFRETPFPSSGKPDQIMLTWSGDPKTTQAIQWRTGTAIEDGVVRYRKAGSKGDFVEAAARSFVFEDRLLRNDTRIHRWTADLNGLEAATEYEYYVGSPAANLWSGYNRFKTAPAKKEPFTWVYFGDTHKAPEWGNTITQAFARHPETAFYTIGGDLVSTGLYRDHWDHLFAYSEHVVSQRPLMPSIGNHDDQDGLGCWMYLENFALPENGPDKLEKERAYSFEYGNALFVILDVTQVIEDQTAWLEQQLVGSSATWKFAIFHFPPYCMETDFDLDYADIRAAWGPLFDKYHMDMVFSGHVHSYMRSKPIRNQQVVDSPKEGTIYVVSIAIPNGPGKLPAKDFGAIWFGGPPLYQTIHIDGNRLEYTAREADGRVRDELAIEK